jgi:peroxiredoxin
MRASFATLVVALAALCSIDFADGAELKSSVGRKIESFTLDDFYGKSHSLADFEGKRTLIVYFLGTECPLAKLYAPRLERIGNELADKGVAVIGIDSNRQDSITEIAAFAEKHGVTFPILKDPGNKVADLFGAERTPQVFVLDADRVVRYQGRVDGSYTFGFGVGFAAPQEKRADMVEAINDLLAGKDVRVPLTESKGCLIGRVRDAKEDSQVTYSKQISRLFNDRCVKCHREGQIAPFAMTSYEEVAGWGEMIAEVVREQRMPPWHADPKFGHFANEDTLSQDEKDLIYAWVDAGCPEGDKRDLPESPHFPKGYLLPREPDQVVYIADEPVDVMAEGVEPYRYYTVDPGFKEDKWVKMAECLPGNPAVVHHIIVFVVPPERTDAERAAGERARQARKERAEAAAQADNRPREEERQRERRGDGPEGDRDITGFGFLAGFAPGTRPMVLEPGYAKKVPAGSLLTFQMHYTPIGSPQKDRSGIGLVFTERKEVKHVLSTSNAATMDFVIPAGANNHLVKAQKTFPRDTKLLSLFPHMHVRGKAFKYEVKYPDGRQEVLLDMPRYDFNWQTSYILAEPKMMPKGTEMLCTALFDNSEENLHNPDSTKEVRWGDQTWEEMMIGWYDVSFPIDDFEQLVKENQEQIKKLLEEEAKKAAAKESGD